MVWKIDGAVVTDAGKRRKGNEDNYYLFGNYKYDTSVRTAKETKTALSEQVLAAVYDGMGGEESGEIASLMASRFFVPCKWDDIRKEAVRQVQAANGAICDEMAKRGGGRMGTTAALLYMDGGKAVCCNVGDSRCYIMRDGIMRRLSLDHSEGENMIRMGIMDPEVAKKSKSWHKLTQHLGIWPEEFVIEPHFSEEISLCEGDMFLLCSDGLTDMIEDEEIAGILGRSKDAEEAAKKLVEAALENGGKDNVTALVLRICKDGETKEQKTGSRPQKTPARIWMLTALLLVILMFIAAVVVAPRLWEDKKQEETEQEKETTTISTNGEENGKEQSHKNE